MSFQKLLKRGIGFIRRRVFHLKERSYKVIEQSGLFDSAWYLENYPDVARNGLDPIQHYLDFGANENRDPGPAFCSAFYIYEYPDVAESGVNPLVHFIEGGRERNNSPVSGHVEHPLLLSEENQCEISKSVRIGVVIHAFYEDILLELLEPCLTIPGKVVLFVAVNSESGRRIVEGFCEKHQAKFEIHTEIFRNVGRNVATLTSLFGKGILASCDVFLHLHTKKSLHTGKEFAAWRRSLVANLVDQTDLASHIVRLFSNRPDLGVISPMPLRSILYLDYSQGVNRAEIARLCGRLRIDVPTFDHFDYPAGCMFWARTVAVRQLLDGRIGYEDFADESGQKDGTFAHAVERIPILLARHNGFYFVEIDGPKRRFSVDYGSRNRLQYRLNTTKRTLRYEIQKAGTVAFETSNCLFMGSIGESGSTVVRKSVLDQLIYARTQRKRILLVDDSGQDELRIRRELEICGVPVVDKIYASNSAVWEKVNKSEGKLSDGFLNVGAQPTNALVNAREFGLKTFYLLSPRNLWEMQASEAVNQGRDSYWTGNPELDELFNDPFEGR